jgi:hypothetical protein
MEIIISMDINSDLVFEFDHSHLSKN